MRGDIVRQERRSGKDNHRADRWQRHQKPGSPVEAARVANERGIHIHTIAIGDRTTVGKEKLDADIFRFLLHPLGLIAFMVVGGAVFCVFALEQAVLLTICLAADRQQLISPGTVLRFVPTKVPELLYLASRVVARPGILAVPFLAAGSEGDGH